MASVDLLFPWSGTCTPCVNWRRPQMAVEGGEGGTLTPTVPLARSQADQVEQPIGRTTALKPPSAIWQRPLRLSGRTPAFESTASRRDTCSLPCKWTDSQLVACDTPSARRNTAAAPHCVSHHPPLPSPPQTNTSERLSIGRAHLPAIPRIQCALQDSLWTTMLIDHTVLVPKRS